MILVNKKQVEPHALNDESHPMHHYAVEVSKGVKYLRDTYGDSIRFKRPGYPKRTEGLDPKGKPVKNMAMPSPPMIIPLTAEVDGKTGFEVWSCSRGAPVLLPNGLYDIGGKRSLTIAENLVVNMKKDADLAFFLYYKSPFYSEKGKGMLVIDDPAAQAKIEGDKERDALELQTALYGVLGDETHLRTIAQSYGVAHAENKHPDLLRKELKSIVLSGEKKKRKDPMSKGIKEFLSDLKVPDSVRLRSLVTVAIDSGKIQWYPDGKYKIGDIEITKVPGIDLQRKFDYLCNHLGNPANRGKLKDVLRDIVDKEYLDGISDDKMFNYLARMTDQKVAFKEKQAVKEAVYSFFVQ